MPKLSAGSRKFLVLSAVAFIGLAVGGIWFRTFFWGLGDAKKTCERFLSQMAAGNAAEAAKEVSPEVRRDVALELMAHPEFWSRDFGWGYRSLYVESGRKSDVTGSVVGTDGKKRKLKFVLKESDGWRIEKLEVDGVLTLPATNLIETVALGPKIGEIVVTREDGGDDWKIVSQFRVENLARDGGRIRLKLGLVVVNPKGEEILNNPDFRDFDGDAEAATTGFRNVFPLSKAEGPGKYRMSIRITDLNRSMRDLREVEFTVP